MMAEAEAMNGIFAQDEVTEAWFRRAGFALTYPRVSPGGGALGDRREPGLSSVVP